MNQITWLRMMGSSGNCLPRTLHIWVLGLCLWILPFEDLQAQTRPVLLDTLRVQVGSRVSSQLPILTRSVQLIGQDEIQSLPARTVSGLLELSLIHI